MQELAVEDVNLLGIQGWSEAVRDAALLLVFPPEGLAFLLVFVLYYGVDYVVARALDVEVDEDALVSDVRGLREGGSLECFWLFAWIVAEAHHDFPVCAGLVCEACCWEIHLVAAVSDRLWLRTFQSRSGLSLQIGQAGHT